MKAQNMNHLNEFVDYFNSFYGIGGIYSAGRNFTLADIINALNVLFTQKPEHTFDGDSYDRELIRDILCDEEEQARMYKTA